VTKSFRRHTIGGKAIEKEFTMFIWKPTEDFAGGFNPLEHDRTIISMLKIEVLSGFDKQIDSLQRARVFGLHFSPPERIQDQDLKQCDFVLD